MLSNHQTRSDFEPYEQAPLRESVYNKKIQKHVPQRLDVTGTSAQFSVRTGLMELLPDECMVGVECCFMNDSVSPSFEQVIYEEIDWVINSGGVVTLSQTQLLPSTTVVVDQGLIKVENLFNGVLTISGNPATETVSIQTKQTGQSFFSTLNRYVASRFTWTFDNFTFNSCQDFQSPFITGGLTTFGITNGGGVNALEWNIQPIDRYDAGDWVVIGIMTLQDTSQSIILQNITNIYQFMVGEYIFISGTSHYNAYFRVQEIVDPVTIRITCGFQDIHAIAVPINDYISLGSLFHVGIKSWACTFVETGFQDDIIPGNQIQIIQYSDGTFEFIVPRTGAIIPSRFVSFKNYYMTEITTQDFNSRMNIQSFTPVPNINNSVLNINIESPLFTSARTYDTSTNSYSQSLASFPVGPNYTVSHRDPVNNRNCSMYQINKNILNNFDIPFIITQNDGKSIYKVQNPDRFFIKFTLWFYAQTDDERYFYIPSL